MGKQQRQQNQNYFNAVVEGDYFRQVGSVGETVMRFGPIVIKLLDWRHAQATCRFHILPTLLKRMDPAFSQMRRCFVMEVRTSNNDPVQGLPIQLQSREQIDQQIETQGLNLISEMYPDLAKLRSRYMYAINNREEFERKERTNAAVFSKVKSTIALNEDLFLAADQQVLDNPMGNMTAKPTDKPKVDPDNLPDPVAGAGGYMPHGTGPMKDVDGNAIPKVLPRVTTLGPDNKPVSDDEFDLNDVDF